MQRLIGSLIWSGTLYVGEYLPPKQLVGPKAGGLEFMTILSGEYIIPAYMTDGLFAYFEKSFVVNHLGY